jgi:hypothetical protein
MLESSGSHHSVLLLEVSMKRVAVPMLVLFSLLALASTGLASDASLKSALKPYKKKLTSDVAYVATFKAPAKSKAGAAEKKLKRIKTDVTGAKNAATGQQASTSKGTTARADVLKGLGYVLIAIKDANSSAAAAKSGKASTAKKDAKAAVKETNKAIPPLEAGGTDLGLF